MAKYGKQAARQTAPASKTTATVVDRVPPAPLDSVSPLLRYSFWGLAFSGLVLLVALSLGSGINADDKFQVDYSQKLVSYYSSGGKDTSALFIPDGNMHLYGGFFEVVTGVANRSLGFKPDMLAYHQLRHAGSAAMAWVAILCAALLARLIAGWQAGLITLLILLLSPRFIGDGLMNPKDIPFAAGYMMALYNLAAVLDNMPRPDRRHVAGLIFGLGIALGIRAGGLLAFGMVGLFGGLHFLLRNGGFQALGNSRAIMRYAVVILSALVGGYLLALLFWPFALQKPLANPFLALSKFSDLEVKIRVLFEGENRMSDKTPWYYPVKWMAITIPLGVLAGFFGSVLLGGNWLRRYNPLWIGMVFFAAIFPVFYVIYKNSVIHDGWRHLTFAYPPMGVLAGLFWADLLRRTTAKPLLRYATIGLLGVGMADASWFIARNASFPYVYFNPLIGGTAGAFGKFETDYWGVSVRQGIEWMEAKGILKPDMPEMVVIATNMYYAAKQLTAKYGSKVKIKYLKWEKRCDDAWDYALYPTRFLDGATLQSGSWPPDNAVHVVEAGGAPLLAVLKDTGKNCSLAMASMKIGSWPSAISYFRKELANVPDNDVAWSNLAQAYLNNDQLEEAREAANKTLAISPDDVQANNLIGMYWMVKNNLGNAKRQFELALKSEPSNPGAYYYLALIAREQNDPQTALSNLMKAIQIAPNFRPAYELSASIYDAMGNPGAAEQFRAAIRQTE